MAFLIKQHRPDFVESDDPLKTHSFETIEQLLEVPFVKAFAELPSFHQFSLSGDANNLIAEYRGGREWWVVGRISLDDVVGLPQWNQGIYETTEGEFPGDQVAWSCGDEVCLKDGRILKRAPK